jgi:hypothetical protein
MKDLSILIPIIYNYDVNADLIIKLDELIKQHPKYDIEVIPMVINPVEKNGSLYNRLLQASEGNYVVFLQEDDIPMDNYLNIIIKGIRNNYDAIDLCGLYTLNEYNKDKKFINSGGINDFAVYNVTTKRELFDGPLTPFCAMKRKIYDFVQIDMDASYNLEWIIWSNSLTLHPVYDKIKSMAVKTPYINKYHHQYFMREVMMKRIDGGTFGKYGKPGQLYMAINRHTGERKLFKNILALNQHFGWYGNKAHKMIKNKLKDKDIKIEVITNEYLK